MPPGHNSNGFKCDAFAICFSSYCCKQVNILLRELCRLHNAPLPSELDTLLLPPNAEFFKVSVQQPTVEDSDAEEIEDATLESEPESEVDEDLSLEMDDGRNANKVRTKKFISISM